MVKSSFTIYCYTCGNKALSKGIKMKTLHNIKLAIVALFLGGAVAFACPGSMCQKNDNGAMCAKKDCKLKMQGKMCDAKGCKHPMQGTVCQSKGCSHKMGTGMCGTKACSAPKGGKMCDLKGMKKMCNTKPYGRSMMPKAYFLKNLRYTLKNLKISKADWADVKLAFASYKTDLKKIDLNTPVKSLQNGKFDRKLFLNSHPAQKKLAAQADLIETIYLLLNADQKKRFPMLMGASQHYFKLHPSRCDQSDKSCN